MIPPRLLVYPVTVVRAAQVPDGYGGTREDWSAATRTTYERAGWLDDSTGREVTDAGRSAEVAELRLWLRPDVDVTGRDRVEVDGAEYAIAAPPIAHRTPDRGVHHRELRLRAVTG